MSVFFSGHLADRFGRVPTLGGACIAIAAALTAYGTASGLGVLLFAASALLGVGWGLTYSLSPVVLTQLVPQEQCVRFFSLLAVALMAGFGLSPVLASALENAGYSICEAFYLTAALCALAGLLFFSLVGPVRWHSTGNRGSTRSSLSLVGIATIMRSPARLPVIMVCIGASVFAGMNNFQTVFADERGLDYADYFLAYTITVVVFRVVLARFKGGRSPYLTIAALQYVMFGSVSLFLVIGAHEVLYIGVAFLFGIGYGVSYPILAAMAANEADVDLLPQTLQTFALSYFIGIFGFPLVAGWLIVEFGTAWLLSLTAALAGIEATMALSRAWTGRSLQRQTFSEA
jgi:MFS family permease